MSNKIESNLLGRFGTADIWTGSKTPVEVVGVFVNNHNPKHPSVKLLVRVTEPCKHTTTGDLHTVDASHCSLK